MAAKTINFAYKDTSFRFHPNHCEMMKITLHDQVFEPYITEEQVTGAIERLAAQISVDYSTKERPLLLVTLNGAFVFGAELFARLSKNFELGFVKLSSYGAQMTSSHNVRVDIEPTTAISGRDVLIAEDIVETGHTLEALQQMLAEMGARSVRTAVLAVKPGIYDGRLPIEYVGMELGDLFVVGSGFDYNEQGRNLRGIYKLVEE